METVINNKSNNQFRGRESSQDNTSETVSNSQLPALNNLTIEESKKVYYVCPFCSEDDFDLIGLKYHLLTYCEQFEKTKLDLNAVGKG